jgi:hypothetical protein
LKEKQIDSLVISNSFKNEEINQIKIDLKSDQKTIKNLQNVIEHQNKMIEKQNTGK